MHGPAMACKAIARRYLRSWLPFDATVVMLDFALALSTASEEPRHRNHNPELIAGRAAFVMGNRCDFSVCWLAVGLGCTAFRM